MMAYSQKKIAAQEAQIDVILWTFAGSEITPDIYFHSH